MERASKQETQVNIPRIPISSRMGEPAARRILGDWGWQDDDSRVKHIICINRLNRGRQIAEPEMVSEWFYLHFSCDYLPLISATVLASRSEATPKCYFDPTSSTALSYLMKYDPQSQKSW